MVKDLTQTFLFNIETDEQFEQLAFAFRHALSAVEEQGYSVEYGGRMLHHPGQIGVIGRSAIGKSTFFNTAMDSYVPPETTVREKLQPSADETRNVLVWKQWVTGKDKDHNPREIRIQDVHAQSALAHRPEMFLEEQENPGITIFEHVDEDADYCDMMMRFSYDEHGRRHLEIHTTEDVAEADAFVQGFLPEVQTLDQI